MPYQILIVEDHPVMRDAYVSVLTQEADFQVCGAVASAEDALAALGAMDDGTPCDLVITDFRLPGMDGADLVARLRRDRPSLPTLVISGHEEAAFARKARRAGAAAFLKKRDLARTLVPTLRRVLIDGAAPGSDGVADGSEPPPAG